MMGFFKLKEIKAKEFLKRITIHDPDLYAAYCAVPFQLNMAAVRDMPKESLEAIAKRRPIIAIANGNVWDVIGGFNTLFLTFEDLVETIFVIEVSDISKCEVEIIAATEFTELLFYQAHRKNGYSGLINAIKKIPRDRAAAKILRDMTSTRRLSKFTGLSRDMIRYQENFIDGIE